ncbi:FAD-dependent oxidoreductase [Microbacterium protaetiae]|uniref:FAD-dependent oxidoreductase n=1 Tax=Microbacterium protaetiae TaxID=2509458 RepID=A0A4P6ECE6_9MICO|nr:FAD-dependent oxidoreductase [Microbacterium protaetiae]QAY59296.1 FAD-dependent oxidoreductase [Microbacterium protaetiae]
MNVAITTGTDHLPVSVDVLVLGSGAAGLVAALRAADAGAAVCVAEKAQLLGGTTSAGGGVMWAPATSLAEQHGFTDSADRAAAYLSAASGHVMDDRAITWYVKTAAEAVDYLLTRTRVRLTPLARPDYRGEWPGAAQGGRSLDNDAFDPADLPGLAARLRPSSYFPLLSMAERDDLDGRAPDPALLADRAARGVRTMGGALVGALVGSALDRGIPIVANARATSLRRRNDDGWDVQFDDVAVGARSVVVATGGFEWNPRLRDAFLAFEITPISAPSNEGDGLEMAMAAGAAVADMTAIWGVPVIAPPTQFYDGKPSGRMGNVEMTLPGSIVVNAAGERFVNEALAYQDTCRMFGDTDPKTGRPRNIPAWLVFDRTFAQKYPIAGSGPGSVPDWAVTADSISELATACGIDAAGLSATVDLFNVDAAAGHDTRFGRGDSAEDRFLGDSTHSPNPCLAPLDTAPFAAVRVYPGVLGTSGGLRTDFHGRVLGWDDAPLPGLYAAGNASASVFRNTYPGGGATIGSAITRAYVVGAAAASRDGDS